MTAPSSVIDPLDPLLARTWRHWWRQKPSLFRIGVGGCGLFVVVHTLLAVRMVIGWQEDAEVKTLREHGVVGYFWEDATEWFEGHRLILAGVWGRSCGNVKMINLFQEGTDVDLERIGRHFKRLESLDLRMTEISSRGLRPLLNCRNLSWLKLDDTDVDDEGVKILAEHPRLESLHLNGTLVTDAVVPFLQKMPMLAVVHLRWTELSLDSIQVLEQSHPDREFIVAIDPDAFPRRIHASIRWSDGTACERFRGISGISERVRYKIHGSPPLKDMDGKWQPEFFYIGLRDLTYGRCELTRDIWELIRKSIEQQNGDFTISLKLGEFESEPISYSVHDGALSIDRFEFQMPVTRQEAEEFKSVEWQIP